MHSGPFYAAPCRGWAWEPRPDARDRAEVDVALRGHIGRLFAARRQVYDSPRIHAGLRREGGRHSRRHVERLMRDVGLPTNKDADVNRASPTAAKTGLWIKNLEF